MNTETLGSSRPLRGDSAAAVDVRCRRGLAGLLALHDDWSVLEPKVRDAGFHHRYAWYASYLRRLERDASTVFFFSFHRNGRAVAIFPLRWRMRTVAGIPLQVWELPSEPHMDLCDVLAARTEDSAARLCELLHALEHQSDLPWDALCLPKLLNDSVAVCALRAAPLSFVHLAPAGRSMYFRCDDAGSALSTASPDFLRNLRRQRRKLDARGRVEVALVRDPAQLDAALAEFLRIEASGWKGCHGCGSAIMLHREVEAFYRDLTQQFGAMGCCSIHLLKLDGRTIAAQYGLVAGRRIHLLKIAYDETRAAEAPGSRLLHEVLLRCCEMPDVDELSLVTGPAWTAGRWNPPAHTVWTGHVFNTTPRGLAAYAMTRLKPPAALAAACD